MFSREFTLPPVRMNPLKEEIMTEKEWFMKYPKNAQGEFSQIPIRWNQVVSSHCNSTKPDRLLWTQTTLNKSPNAYCEYLRRPGCLWDVTELWSQHGVSSPTCIKGFCWAKQSISHSHWRVIDQQTACRVKRSTSLYVAQSCNPQKVISISSAP